MKNNFNLKIKEHIVTPEGKKFYNRVHFTESAPKYDFATKALSLGQDVKWKKILIGMLPDMSAPKCLDLACGTGDITFELAKKYPEGKIEGIDITDAMLEIAKDKNKYSNITFQNADIADLPYRESTFDIVTGSYALRNAPDILTALQEISRVLKTGGTFAFLDFSKPESKFFEKYQYYLLKFWGSFWGMMLHANPEVHGYISASLEQYPRPKELNRMLKNTGFSIIKNKKVFLGMLSIMILRKDA